MFGSMFGSSLRKRREWAPALAQLGHSWKETALETHDVAFPTRLRRGRDGWFRILLLSAGQVGTAEASERIERLPLLDGAGKVALVFLVGGHGNMAALMALQMQVVTGYDGCIPVIPVSSAAQLPSCLDSLRRQCAVPGPRADGQAVACC